MPVHPQESLQRQLVLTCIVLSIQQYQLKKKIIYTDMQMNLPEAVRVE